MEDKKEEERIEERGGAGKKVQERRMGGLGD